MNTKERIIGLLKYIEELARIPEKAIYSVRSYRSMMYFEHQLRGRLGIQHDVVDDEGTVWLRIERLQREPPPFVAPHLAKWITVSRDPGSVPQFKNAILEKLTSSEAKALLDEGRVDPEDVMLSAEADSDKRDVRIRLDRYPETESELRAYVSGPWRDWSEKEKVRRETIAVYDKFFATIQSIETEGADNPIEVVLGLGFVLWQVDGKTIEHPLIEALVEIDIDQQSHAIRLRPRDADPQLYVRPLVDLGNPGVAQLDEFANRHFAKLAEEDPITNDLAPGFSPFVPASFQSLLEQAASRLSSSGVYAPADLSDRTLPKPTDTLTITDTWAIYVRPRSANLFVQDIQRLKKDIESRPEENLPPSITRWVSPPEAGDHSLDSVNLGLGIGHCQVDPPTPQAAGFSDCDVLFPKPFNKAQVEIVERLSRDDGVVVQGPPGTGKTHTIANIICHYLATGRNVLVVSKGEPALEVLRDQIPNEVRELTISLLTNERQGLKQLEAAVTYMANHVVNLNAGKLNSRRQECEQEVLTLRETISCLDKQMCEWAERHLTPVAKRLAGEEGHYPAQLAELISDRRTEHGWLDDNLGAEEAYEPRFTTQDIDAIRSARSAIGCDLIYFGVDLPCPHDLPSPAAICAVHEDLCRASELNRVAESKHLPSLSVRCTDPWNRAEALLQGLRGVELALSAIGRAAWMVPIYRKWLENGVATEATTSLCQVVKDIDRLIAEQHTCFSTNVSIPPLGSYRDEVTGAVRRASKGERLFPFLAIGKSDAKGIVSRIRVDGGRPQNPTAWQKVLRQLDYLQALANLVERWNRMAAAFGLPIVTSTVGNANKWLHDTQTLFQTVQPVVEEFRSRWCSEIAALFPNSIAPDKVAYEKSVLALAIESLESALGRHKLNTARDTIESIESLLVRCDGPAVSAAEQFLRDRVGSTDETAQRISDQWLDHLREFERLRSLRAQMDVVVRVSGLVEASGAVKWARRLRTEPVSNGNDPLTPLDWESSWRHRRLCSYLSGIDGRLELKELSRRRIEEDRRLTKVMTEVIQLRTYLGLQMRMSGAPLASLIQFAHAIRQIGAGTGIRAQRYRGDARRAMLGCIGSVPCWIMPTWRVSEALPAETGVFDLVIIDEASQSDAMALPALLRAKKVLVVGDDRQVSPAPVGLEERRLLQLRHSYLKGQPFADMLMPGTSLYDLAQAVFPGNRILLNEHFRCVEPIIRFSFQFYPERIRPVRIPKPSERLDPPLVDVFVDGGQRDGSKVNDAEAVAIVDEIERIIGDPAYKDRTIGVVSLIGHQQAYRIQELLLDRIGEDAYLRFRIACGDAATFQGKERDIMFVSMVASPGQCQAQTARLFEQRFNVALSRARDRMYLFRSVSLDDLRNPNDLKRRVLNHFQNPMPTDLASPKDLSGRCESEFERKVFRRLCEMGYRVTPQVSVGDFRIDLVVDGETDRRLAIELDGDRYHGPERWFEDWSRQKILERVGWTFWRCWASSFALAPDECMTDLVATMASMGIEPIGQDNTAHSYTEHRIHQVNLTPESATDAIPTVHRAEIGDTLVVSLDNEINRHRMLTLSRESDDLENGVISVDGEIGKMLLGASVEDEIEVLWKGENRRAMVVSIEKGSGATSGDDVSEGSLQFVPEVEHGSGKDGELGAAASSGLKQPTRRNRSDVSAASSQKRMFLDEPQSSDGDGQRLESHSQPASSGSNDVATVKSAWEMRRNEFLQYRQSQGCEDIQENNRFYWQEIKRAREEGKPIDPETLHEYDQIFRSPQD